MLTVWVLGHHTKQFDKSRPFVIQSSVIPHSSGQPASGWFVLTRVFYEHMQPDITDPQDLSEPAQERVRRSFSNQAFMSTLGAELTTVGKGVVEIRLPFSNKLTQQNGYIHAGAVIAVLDSACGYAALSVARDGVDVLTVELKTNLLAPASGNLLIAKGQVKKAGKTLTVCTADAFAITDTGEKLVATMLATIINLPTSPAE